MPTSVYDVPIDEGDLGRTSPFEVLQHGRLRIAVASQDFTEPPTIRFSRTVSSVPSRWDWIDKHLLWRTPLARATERASSYVLWNNSRPSGRSMYARIVRPAIAPIVVTEQLSRSLDHTAP